MTVPTNDDAKCYIGNGSTLWRTLDDDNGQITPTVVAGATDIKIIVTRPSGTIDELPATQEIGTTTIYADYIWLESGHHTIQGYYNAGGTPHYGETTPRMIYPIGG